MGNTFKLGNYVNGIFQDSSNNIGIGAAPSGTYKFEVTGTAKVSGILTLGSTISNGTYTYTLPSATGTLALTSALGDYLPLTGGTLTGALSGTSATFSDLIVTDTYANDPLIKLATTTSGNVEVQIRTATTTYNAGIGVVTSGYDFGFFTNNTTRMTITSAGLVGIGTSSPSAFVDIRKNTFTPSSTSAALLVEERGTYQMAQEFYIHNAGIYLSGRPSGGIGTCNSGALRIAGGGIINDNFTPGGTTTFVPTVAIGSVLSMGDYDPFIFYGTGGLTAGTAVNMANYERMRITSAGDVKIGTTPTANGHNFFMEAGNGAYQTIGHPSGASTGYSYTLYYYNSGVLGGISQSGTTAVVYNTTSDYRLKEVISPIQNSIDTIFKLKPVLFKWKNTEDEYGEGFIAHELQEVVPLAVTGEKDAVNEDGSAKLQQVDHSKLVPHLVAAIQELSAQNQDLKSRLDKAGL